MAVDLKQFHQVFIEESVEGLEAMESSLMELDIDELDDEIINTIFRSAHSIKGGAGTFGFSALASFTHVLETLLDEVRSGDRSLTLEQVDLLLKSVDCMRDMLDLIRDDRNEFTGEATEIQTALEAVLAGGDKNAPIPSQANDEESETSHRGAWKIIFKPEKNIIRTGNDPLRILRELDHIADTYEVSLMGEAPDISAYSPEDCIFSWELTLTGESLSKPSIAEVFEWVEDECELEILELDSVTDNDGSHTDSNGSDISAATAQSNDQSGWCIEFIPHSHLFQTGNDPLRIIKELSGITKIETCDLITKAIPPFESFDGEQCYLSWRIYTAGDAAEADIETAFEWVTDDCELKISRRTLSANVASSVRVAASVEPASESEPSKTDLESTAAESEPALSSKPAVGGKVSKSKPTQKKSASQESSSIRVGIDKIDSLINMVGELVITQSMLGQLGTDFEINSMPKLIEGLGQLEQNTRELQESVMRIRMLPISFAFSRFPRMVRDLGASLNKKINLVLQGENTELDKTVMEKIGDPLVHLVRNSVDHGIETAEDRIKAGKPEDGTVTLNAYHQGGNVVIEIIDDGRGLDREKIAAKGIERGLINDNEVNTLPDEQIFDLIFNPGFSTAAQVSNLSGRGVGMDVVKKNIQALNGVVEIQSKKGQGTKIRIALPLTLAILDGQLVGVGEQTYIFPLVSIVESMQYREEFVNHIAGGCSVFKLREEYVPIIDLSQCFGSEQAADYDAALMVVVESDGYKVAMVVDELLAQQQVVIKSLEKNYKRVEGVSGATILGDGTVALIIDVPGVVRLVGADKLIQQNFHQKSA